MRVLRFLAPTILLIMLGASICVCAQDEKQQEDKPRQENVKPQSAPDEAKSPKQEEANPPKHDEAKPTKQEEKETQKQEKETRDHAAPEHPEQPNGQMPARQDQMHPSQGGNAGNGGHIPDKQFHAHFGHEHTFRANTAIVSGQPQFQYGGYTFELVNAWPGDWAYTDDCYIDYIDGEYFLFDLLHPGVRVAVFVVM
jgi:pyruvate/2-oxoglutarate dehydrogenase complex dihydrolipoamide acyltransferase (E2) component